MPVSDGGAPGSMHTLLPWLRSSMKDCGNQRTITVMDSTCASNEMKLTEQRDDKKRKWEGLALSEGMGCTL
jgi:hypothetical protein